MTKALVLGMFACFALLAAACEPQPADVAPPTLAALPTLTETFTPEPTPTPFERATLPPTWTPTDTPTEPPVPPTPTLDPTVAELQHNASTDVCASFREETERNPTEVVVGNPVQVYWTPVLDAVRYEVSLYDGRGFRVFFQNTEDTTFIFPPDQFEGNSQYGWSVVPYDWNDLPMCPPRGSEFRSRLQ